MGRTPWTRYGSSQAESACAMRQRGSARRFVANRSRVKILAQLFQPRTVRERRVPVDLARTHQFRERLFHGDHSIGAAGSDRCVDLMIFAAANQIAHRVSSDHDLNRRDSVRDR